ncbi:MAG: hypothetical protein RR084_07160 [Bacteroidales bacterium]
MLFWLILLGSGLSFGVAQNTKTEGKNDLQLAQRYRNSGQMEKALHLYESLYEKDPQVFIYQEYLSILLDLQQYAQAEKLVRKQAKKEASTVFCTIDLGQIYLLQGQKAKAEKQFKKITEETDFSSVRYSFSEVSQYLIRKTATYDYSIQLYQNARKWTGLSEMYAYELAVLYRLSWRIPEMMEEYLTLLEKHPQAESQVWMDLQALVSGSESKSTDGGAAGEGAGGGVGMQIKKILYQKVQKQAGNKTIQDLLIWILVQEKDFEQALNQAQTYLQRFRDGGKKWYEIACMADENEYFNIAEKAYRSLIERYEKENTGLSMAYVRKSKINLLNLYFKQLEKQQIKEDTKIQELKKEYQNLLLELGKEEALPLCRNLARIYAYYTQQGDSAVFLLEQALAWPNLSIWDKAQLKVDLADILLFLNRIWDATLLYGQVEKDFKQDAIGFYAKLQNARLFYYIGEFEWAKSQLDVLKAATSKTIANDAMELSLLIKENNNSDSNYLGLSYVSRADGMVYRRLYLNALSILDSVLTLPGEEALWEDVYYKKAQIYIKIDSVDQALDCFKKVYDGYPTGFLADDALFLSANLLENKKCQEGVELGVKSGHVKDKVGTLRKMEDTEIATIKLENEKQERSWSECEENKEQAKQRYERIFTEFTSSSLVPLARERYRILRGDNK